MRAFKNCEQTQIEIIKAKGDIYFIAGVTKFLLNFDFDISEINFANGFLLKYSMTLIKIVSKYTEQPYPVTII